MSKETSTLKGIENGRAEFAFNCVKNASKNKDYKNHVKKVPMLIKTNGLGSAMAYVYSQNKESYKTIYQNIYEWLKHAQCPIKDLSLPEYNENNRKELLNQIIAKESTIYRASTIEVLAFIGWLKHFADGLIED